METLIFSTGHRTHDAICYTCMSRLGVVFNHVFDIIHNLRGKYVYVAVLPSIGC